MAEVSLGQESQQGFKFKKDGHVESEACKSLEQGTLPASQDILAKSHNKRYLTGHIYHTNMVVPSKHLSWREYAWHVKIHISSKYSNTFVQIELSEEIDGLKSSHACILNTRISVIWKSKWRVAFLPLLLENLMCTELVSRIFNFLV